MNLIPPLPQKQAEIMLILKGSAEITNVWSVLYCIHKGLYLQVLNLRHAQCPSQHRLSTIHV